jgi:hypothetical protein
MAKKKKILYEPYTPVERDPVEKTYIMLLLAAPSTEKEVPFNEIKKWTAEQRAEAEKYAAEFRALARDDKSAQIEMPEFLKIFFIGNN